MITITPEYLASHGLSANFEERFWAKVDKSAGPKGCWPWKAAIRKFRGKKTNTGHGQIFRGMPRGTPGPRLIFAHQASWILHEGEIPEGFQVQHCCPGKSDPRCVNPAHLKLGLAKDNTKDSIAEGTIFLHKGHHHTGRAEKNPNSVFTNRQREEIRARYTGKKGEQNALAEEYGVSQGAIWLVLAGGRHREDPCPGLLARESRIKAEHDRVKRERWVKGDGNASTKVTESQRREILAQYTGKRGEQSALARKYGVSQATIWNVVNHIGGGGRCGEPPTPTTKTT